MLQMNFRGSSGYGDAWYSDAHQDWGGLTYNDITDGTRWAIGGISRASADQRRGRAGGSVDIDSCVAVGNRFSHFCSLFLGRGGAHALGHGGEHGADRVAEPADAEAAIENLFGGGTDAKAVIEEYLEGEEASFFVLADGTHAVALATALAATPLLALGFPTVAFGRNVSCLRGFGFILLLTMLVLLAGAAGILAMIGKKQVSQVKGKPQRTIDNAQQTVETLKQAPAQLKSPTPPPSAVTRRELEADAASTRR